MRWDGDSNPELVDAVIASFQGPPERARDRLSQFKPADWERTEIWLNTSGLALYFLDRIRSAGISDAIDTSTLCKLEQNLSDNRSRTADMLQEFVAINRAFQDAGMRYANLKGATLSPDSCPTMSLSCDLPFFGGAGVLRFVAQYFGSQRSLLRRGDASYPFPIQKPIPSPRVDRIK